MKNGNIIYGIHTNNFNRLLQVPPNMPVGPNPLILPKPEGSYFARLKHAFYVLCNENPVLIILDNYSMKPKLEEIQEAEKTTSHQRLVKGSLVSCF